ncbi:MAG: DUF3857 domain-containing protein [Archangium sp.]
MNLRVGTWWCLTSLLCSCAGSLPPLDVKSLPAISRTDERYRDAKWDVLLDEQEAEFLTGKEGPEVRITERWRIKVLRPVEVPPIVVHYSRTFEEVESIRGRIIDRDGKEKSVDVSKRSDQPAFSNSSLFTDSRVTVVPVPAVPVDGVFEYEVVTRHRSMQHFVVSQRFGGSEPIELSRLVAIAPKDWDVRWKLLTYEGEPFEPTQGERDGRRTLTFERKQLNALEPENAGPPAATRLPLVVLRLETWKDNGVEKHPPSTPQELSKQLFDGYQAGVVPTPELEETVKKVLTGVEDTPDAKAQALYEHVCREVQYCAIEIGLGGWFPHSAKDVHAARYGDCKDKANYLHTLLKIAGVESFHTLIFSHEGTPREFTLPSMGANFNHEILAVQLGERLVFADPTWRAVPFGELPPNDQGAPVLLVSKGGHDVQLTPESKAEDNTESQVLKLTLEPDGDASGTFVITATGARALPWKSRWLEGTGQAKRFTEQQLWVRAPLVREVKQTTKSDFAKTSEVEGTLGARRVASRVGDDKLLIRPVDLFEPWMQTWDTKRKSAVVARFVDTRSITVELQLPPGSTLAFNSISRKVEGPTGLFTLSAKVEGTMLKLERRFERKNRRVVPGALNGFNRFVDQVTEAESQPVFVKLGGAK